MADQKKHEGLPERDSAAKKPDEKQQGSMNKSGQAGRGDLPGQGSSHQDRGTGGTPGSQRERPGTGAPQEEDEELERNRDRSRATKPGQDDRSA